MKKSIAACAAALLAALAMPPAHAAPRGFPAYVTLPPAAQPKGDGEIENYGQAEFSLQGRQEIYRGKYWSSWLDTAALGSDERKVLAQMIAALAKSGWQVVLKDEPRNPPLATLKLAKDGKEAWASLEAGSSESHLTVVERGPLAVKLELAPPAAGIEKVAADADFPFLKHFPGARLSGTSKDDAPLLVKLQADQEPAAVATARTIKQYDAAKGTGRLEVIAAYSAALKAAGWQIVEENTALTTGDPNLTAHYAKPPLDLWTWIHTDGRGIEMHVGDAGAEHASSKLKADLDRACKVAIYGVNFDFNKATLRPDSDAALASILKLLSDYPELKVELGGHTDNVGTRDYNFKLSDSRVAAVRAWLGAKGIAAARLSSKGYADTQPVASNDSPEGRARNRRVELKKPDCRK